MVRKQGAKPITRTLPRMFHERFPEAAGLAGIPDFNTDAGLWMPDQDQDGAPSECTGYWNADAATDIFKKLFSPDWHYAMTLWLEGEIPNELGADPDVAMQVGVLLGFLTSVSEGGAPFNAKSVGELYAANWRNWGSVPSSVAAPFAQNGVLDALGNGDPLSSIIAASYTAKMPVSCTTPWYMEWNESTPPSGVMPMPASPSLLTVPGYGQIPYHNYAIKGQKTINGQVYGIVKAWNGANFGDHGFGYIGQDVAQAVFTQPQTGARIFDPQAIRVLGELKIIVEHFFPILRSQLPASVQAAPTGA